MRNRRFYLCLSGWVFLLWTVSLSAQAPLAQSLPVPEALQPHIAFWTHIFTAIETNGGVLHDADDLRVVYHTFRRLPAHRRQDFIDRQRESIERRLRALADRDAQASREGDESLLALFPSPPTPERLHRAAENIRFQRGLRDQFARGLERSGAYLPTIRRIFKQAELPEALTALPYLESAFHPRAYSKAGAAGLWQFITSTGRLYLTIDEAVDERFDVYRSSTAAAQLLRDNYRRLGTWPLAVTAYNHGVGGMLKAVSQLQTKDFGTIVEQYKSRTFGFASRNFYAELLAILVVVNSRDIFFPGLVDRQPKSYHTLKLNAYVTLSTLETYLGSDRKALARWNPAWRKSVRQTHLRIPKGYTLRVPTGRMTVKELKSRWAAIPKRLRFKQQLQPRTYRARRGDTLSAIAGRVGVSVQQLARRNGLKPPYRVRAGSRLQLPYHPVTQGQYRVQSGEVLSAIAERVVTTVSALAKLNQLKPPYNLRVGQVLKVPALDSQSLRYWVAPGETLSSIAKRADTAVEAIAALNDLKPSDGLRAGRILRLPRMQTTSRR